MRAGKLDKRITIQRATEARDEFGVVTLTWVAVATVWAQVVQATMIEYLRGAGISGDAAVVFQVRHIDGVTTRDRVLYAGAAHDIKEIKEIGRRRGLEIRTVAAGAV